MKLGEIFIGYERWRAQSWMLNRMGRRDLTRAYVSHPAIQAYVGLGFAATAAAIWLSFGPQASGLGWTALASLAAVAAYPLIWHLLHRFVLHGAWMRRSPLTARIWKRVHYDHHMHPNDLGVLFGALYTTLPTILITTGPIGYAVAGSAGAFGAIAAALATTCVYEFFHCIQHLNYQPKWAWTRRIKDLHLIHHFHNETVNFGITNVMWDRLLGTHGARAADLPRSPTVRNLGYDAKEAARYPWVANAGDGGRGGRGGDRRGPLGAA